MTQQRVYRPQVQGSNFDNSHNPDKVMLGVDISLYQQLLRSEKRGEKTPEAILQMLIHQYLQSALSITGLEARFHSDSLFVRREGLEPYDSEEPIFGFVFTSEAVKELSPMVKDHALLHHKGRLERLLKGKPENIKRLRYYRSKFTSGDCREPLVVITRLVEDEEGSPRETAIILESEC